MFPGKEGCKHQWVRVHDASGGIVAAATGMYWFRCRFEDCGRIEACYDERGPNYEKITGKEDR
jgi:hypothetical protein